MGVIVAVVMIVIMIVAVVVIMGVVVIMVVMMAMAVMMVMPLGFYIIRAGGQAVELGFALFAAAVAHGAFSSNYCR